jgi:parallel beta-helix repeat protein
MSHYAAWRAYVFVLLSCFPLLLSAPAAIAPVRSVSPTSPSVQTAVRSDAGPRATITCPADAVNIAPDRAIQPLVNMSPGGTTFCLRAGVHRLSSSIQPKTGNTFVGEFGAILDGTGWSTTDPDAAAFKALSVNVDYVTIRNLTIRNMPQHGITIYYLDSDHWTIEYNEIANNKFGIEFAPNSTIRYNYIHHNVSSTPTASRPAERGGGYLCQRCDNSVLEGNEIAYNGMEQKVANHSANVVFRNNFVHHNLADGIWYDTNPNAAALIDGNRVEDNGRDGVSFEASIGATIRNNTVRRNGDAAVFISMSQNAQIYNNSLEANLGGIEYFLNCDSLPGGEDVKNNAAHDNTVVVGTQSSAYASGFGSTSCTSGQLTPYLNGAKKLTFSHNAYRVPSRAYDRYFLWGGWTFWNDWQRLGHDVEGSLSQ